MLKEIDKMNKLTCTVLFVCLVLLFGCISNKYSNDPGYLKCMKEKDADHCMTSGGQNGCDPSSRDVCMFYLAMDYSDVSICEFINPDVPTDWPFSQYTMLTMSNQTYSEYCRNIIAVSENESICENPVNQKLSVACLEYWQYM